MTVLDTSAAVELQAQLNSAEAVQFVGGFLKGFLGNDYIAEITECTRDIKDETKNVQTAITDFKSGGTQVESVVAVQEFVSIILDWPSILMDCAATGTQMVEDIKKLGEWADFYREPGKAAKIIAVRLARNVDEIFDKVENIEGYWSPGTYYEAGQELSELSTLALGPAEGDGTIQVSTCWKDAKGRGGGSAPSLCPEGMERNGALCYPLCDEGYVGVSHLCWQRCPEDFKNDGAFCRKPMGYGRGRGYRYEEKCEEKYGECEKDLTLWYQKCKPGYHARGLTWCSTDCPEDMPDAGISCRKTAYNREVGSQLICPEGKEKHQGLCYPPCPEGYNGSGPVCWGQCPEGKQGCGGICLGEGETCTNYLLDQAQQGFQALFKFFTGDYMGGAVDVAEIVGEKAYPNCSNPDTDVFTLI